MDKKTFNIIQYITGVLLIAQALQLISTLAYNWGWLERTQITSFIIVFLGTVLMAVSMFAESSSLSMIGAGVIAFGCLVNAISESSSYLFILIFLACMFFILAKSPEKSSIKFGIVVIAQFLYATEFVFPMRQTIFSLLKQPLSAISAVMVCFVIQNASKVQSAKATQTAQTANTDNRVEALTKLKELLDSGVITQEEFDAKKKQILGV